jgi:hypothetical protein
MAKKRKDEDWLDDEFPEDENESRTDEREDEYSSGDKGDEEYADEDEEEDA